jgi:DNA-binding NtrC family response regulator
MTLPRVLIVDDQEGPRESLRMLLKPDYQTVTAENAREALAWLPVFRPDVILADIKMPEVDGIELLQRVKATDPSIAVVMITAYTSSEIVALCKRHGAVACLAKPFMRADIEEVMRRALGGTGIVKGDGP